MSSKTQNYNLNKYDANDEIVSTINGFSQNMDILDENLKNVSDKVDDKIPTKVGQLENDIGYITNFIETDPTVPSHVKNITEANIKNWNNKSDFSGSYNDLDDKPTIPSEYILPTASPTTLGGIKIGAGLVMNGDTLNATGGGTADSVDWENVFNKPISYTPSSHTHTSSEVTDLAELLNNKQNTLIAGNNISIENNVISATSGGGEITNDANTTIPIYKEWVGTETEYEAITTLDPNTRYNIIEE